MASKASNRPLSPHLMHVRWPINMMVSIIHRATGSGMATVGTALLVWWLAALAAGKESYGYFMSWFTGDWAPLGYVVAVGLTLSLFQHMASGVRHFVMDVGANYELKGNRTTAWLTLFFSVTATVLYWAYVTMAK
ncbi:succinate dehydrogenase, cytochrome b556 subunit [Sphingomonas sp. PB4P5]|uniref:succinate dehydrogenase, cytochrome b556 subunit n=1 Tax=Parasphingomonas puruogangriensis TaxID=3096155 RepID=UPI002FCAFDD8